MEQEKLLEMELSGFNYRHDPIRTKIWKETSTHVVIPKKKYAYIDQKINGVNLGGSGKALVQTSGKDVGTVWSIKGYGQRGYSRGNVDEQIAVSDNNIKQLIKAIEQKSATGNFGLTLNKNNRKHIWVG